MTEPLQHTIPLVQYLLLKKRIILLSTATFALLVGIYSFIMPVTYRSVVRVIMSESKQGGLSSMLAGLPIATGGSTGGVNVNVIQEMIKSYDIGEYIIKHVGVDTMQMFSSVPRADLSDIVISTMDSEVKRFSNVVELTCDLKTGFFPNGHELIQTAKLSSEFCNNAVNGLDSLNRSKSVSTARRTRLYIEKVLSRTNKQIDSVQRLFVQYQQKNRVVSLDDQASLLVSNAVATGTELAKAEMELRVAKEQYQVSTPMIQMLEKKVNTLREQFSKTQSGGVNDNDKLSLNVDVIPALSKDYLNMVRDLKILEQMKAYLESQRMQEAIQEERDVPTLQVIDAARIPSKRYAPARTFMVVTALVVGFVLSCLAVILNDMIRHYVADWKMRLVDSDMKSTTR